MVIFLLLLILFFIVVFLAKIKDKWIHIWLSNYVYSSIIPKEKADIKEPTHIMFCFVDHFEPGTGKVDTERERKRVDSWVEGYPRLADKHRDSNGICPQHTWFFPPHYHRQDHLEKLVELCRKGYGEIEMHLHHSFDTPDGLRRKIENCIDDYSKFGIFGLENQKKSYAFIHGNWSLANSRGDKYCGVNNELQILKDTGCYGDFTFPCLNEAQPSMINCLYYAFFNKNKCKSYDKGIYVGSNESKNNGLIIIQGPIGIRWKSRTHKFYPSIEASNVCCTDPPTIKRIDYWIKSRICVKKKLNWIFIKVHCHGALEEDKDVLLGDTADKMYSYLESKYNDGKKYLLHYVTARELYNIIKAAEVNKIDNPRLYRNFIISKPEYRKD